MSASLSRVDAQKREMKDSTCGEVDASHMKQGVDFQYQELAQSPYKKVKSIESREERKGKAAKRLRKISIKERCLMKEKVIYAEGAAGSPN